MSSIGSQHEEREWPGLAVERGQAQGSEQGGRLLRSGGRAAYIVGGRDTATKPLFHSGVPLTSLGHRKLEFRCG